MTKNEEGMKKLIESSIIKTLEKYGSRFLEDGFPAYWVREEVEELNFVHKLEFGVSGMEISFSESLYNLIAGDCSEKIYNEFKSKIEKLGWESEERNYTTVYYSPIPLTA